MKLINSPTIFVFSHMENLMKKNNLKELIKILRKFSDIFHYDFVKTRTLVYELTIFYQKAERKLAFEHLEIK